MMRPSRSFFIPLTAAAFAAALGVVRAYPPPAARAADPPRDEWKAPAYAAAKKNPVPADEKSIAAGKRTYAANCAACHGNGGKGDGPAAPSLERPPGDLTSAKAQAQSDGALFWKITTGRKPMTPAPKEVTEVQRWQVVNYVRTFAPKSGK
jgi:mono/diheme cytochrome c family protein